jgi:lysine-ketoglutarate reductase/saccharopine dehydrogenase-like protein (TIGR00300 family)
MLPLFPDRSRVVMRIDSRPMAFSMRIRVSNPKPASAVEEVEIRGHIIDSLILPRVLDAIINAGGSFNVKDFAIGHTNDDESRALIEVQAETPEKLHDILTQLSAHGAVPTSQGDCSLATADIDGVFPEGFYATTNQHTQVRIRGSWVDVQDQEMDCGIVIDMAASDGSCLPMTEVKKGMQLVIGYSGVRVFPEQRQRDSHFFEFMNSSVSTEKPKGVAVREIARHFFECKQSGAKAAIVGGPAIIHTGSAKYLSWLIQRGYVSMLLAGNALAAHDIERAMYGTSLGVDLEHGNPVEAGHEHHLRSINRIRRAGGIAKAVDDGLLTSGVMFDCVKNEVPFLLAGSIRDDGPLPEVITDVLEAQAKMREMVQGIRFCLMIATTLHSVAVGNLLPAWVKVVCVDINPSTVIKLSDRGSFQTVGLVTDVEPFMRTLNHDLEELESAAAN